MARVGEILIIAGKEEGFSYSDAYIENVVDSARVVHQRIAELNEDGYKHFITAEVIDRIDFKKEM